MSLDYIYTNIFTVCFAITAVYSTCAYSKFKQLKFINAIHNQFTLSKEEVYLFSILLKKNLPDVIADSKAELEEKLYFPDQVYNYAVYLGYLGLLTENETDTQKSNFVIDYSSFDKGFEERHKKDQELLKVNLDELDPEEAAYQVEYEKEHPYNLDDYKDIVKYSIDTNLLMSMKCLLEPSAIFSCIDINAKSDNSKTIYCSKNFSHNKNYIVMTKKGENYEIFFYNDEKIKLFDSLFFCTEDMKKESLGQELNIPIKTDDFDNFKESLKNKNENGLKDFYMLYSIDSVTQNFISKSLNTNNYYNYQFFDKKSGNSAEICAMCNEKSILAAIKYINKQIEGAKLIVSQKCDIRIKDLYSKK